MAVNKAVILELNEFMDAKQYTVAARTSISKGDLQKLSGDNTAIISSSDDEVYAGVAAADKDSTDTSTTLGIHVPGALNRFDMKVNATVAVTLGAEVVLSGENLIRNAAAGDLLLGKVIGKAQEAGAVSEVIVILS